MEQQAMEEGNMAVEEREHVIAPAPEVIYHDHPQLQQQQQQQQRAAVTVVFNVSLSLPRRGGGETKKRKLPRFNHAATAAAVNDTKQDVYVAGAELSESQSSPMVTILDDVSGIAHPGELLAVMGPSGSGKTTLLNCLSMRNTKFTGQVLYNGFALRPEKAARLSGFVQQLDMFMPTLTPLESLTFKSRLSGHPEAEYRVKQVLDSLGLRKTAYTLIGGEGSMVKGISGGERKRLSIALELLSDPPVIFLDEPTSGLDSYMAESAIKMLKRLASAEKRTIIATIHQPSSSTFDMFTHLMLLAEGRTAYFGPVRSVVSFFSAMGYTCPPFHNPADYIIKLISTTYKTEEMEVMEAEEKTEGGGGKGRGRDGIVASVGDEEGDGGGDGGDVIDDGLAGNAKAITGAWAVHPNRFILTPEIIARLQQQHQHQLGGESNFTSPIKLVSADSKLNITGQRVVMTNQPDAAKDSGGGDDGGGGGSGGEHGHGDSDVDGNKSNLRSHSKLHLGAVGKKMSTKANVNFGVSSRKNTTVWEQFCVLLWRNTLMLRRDPMLTRVRLAQAILVGILAGLIYLRLAESPVAQGDVQSILGGLFFILLSQCVQGAIGLLQSFPHEAPVMIREYSDQLYGIFPYFMARSLVELPVQILAPFLQMTLFYFLVGFPLDGEVYIKMIIAMMSSTMAAFSLGYVIGALIASPPAAVASATMFLMPLILFGGLLLNIDDTPEYFYWLAYLSFMRYGYGAASVAYWSHVGALLCPAEGNCAFPTGDDVLDYLNFGHTNHKYWFYIACNALLIVGLRTIALLLLTRRANKDVKKGYI